MAQRIHRRMDFRAQTAFGSIIARPRAPFGCRLEGTTSEHRRRGCGGASLRYPQHRTQVLHNGVKDPGLEPALALLIHRMPGRQVMRHHVPCHPCSDHPAQAIKDLAYAVFPLGGVFGHQSQIRGDQSPFLIADITGICFACHITGLTGRE
jgi:hypothetical protein